MKIKVELELDTEKESDAELIRRLVELIEELRKDYDIL